MSNDFNIKRKLYFMYFWNATGSAGSSRQFLQLLGRFYMIRSAKLWFLLVSYIYMLNNLVQLSNLFLFYA